MSQSPESEYLRELLLEDKKLMDQLPSLLGDNQKTLELFAKRISLYRRFAKESTNPLVQHIILARLDNVILNDALINTTHQLHTDIAKLGSRLDDLESKH